MGGSSSKDTISEEQHELETLATSTGSLLMLQKAFSKLADPETNSIPLQSLQECFCLNFKEPISEASVVPESFPKLLLHLGPAIVDLFFMANKGGVDWIHFLKGYINCCGRMPASTSINVLYRLYAATSLKAGAPSKIEFESDDTDCKISGYFTSTDVLMFLWVCWVMSQSLTMCKFTQGKAKLNIPDTNHLLLSAITSCVEDVKDLNLWECNISDLDVQLPAQKLHMWVLSTVPGLAQCFNQYVHERLQRCDTLEDNLEASNSPISDTSITSPPNKHLLTCGRAWAISLTLRGSLSEEVLKSYIVGSNEESPHNLLYRSSLHGRGLNRFWSNVDGYHGPLLILISASSEGSTETDSSTAGKFVIGVLTGQGFENKDVFYGSSGNLYAISPIFHVYSHHGKEKNFVYSHLQPSGYNPHPKPVGAGFGGTIGNERISIDEDFVKVTLRHHVVDKTYQHGPLLPNQGFLPLEASIMDMEVWGLGGEMATKDHGAYKNREQLFTEQRRKVDLKTFGNWEDSPEKMMMDMVSDPNRVRREER